MKDRENDSKNEKYFDFSKMDKKNVQNPKAKILLTVENFCDDVEKICSQIKRKNKKL